MPFPFLWFPLIVALLDWAVVTKGWKTLEYLTKPGTMGAVLIWMGYIHNLMGPDPSTAFKTGPAGSALSGVEAVGLGPWNWFALGIVFSLFGDVFLMLPREQFIAGLVSFLLAHVAYIMGLNLTPPPMNAATLALFFMVGATGIRIYRRIRAGLAARGKENLGKPIFVYVVVIGFMLLSALQTLVRGDEDWSPPAALWVSAGAMLFFISDTLLAWNRFVAPIAHERLKVRITYHLGQIALVVGSGLHFLS